MKAKAWLRQAFGVRQNVAARLKAIRAKPPQSPRGRRLRLAEAARPIGAGAEIIPLKLEA